MVDLHPGPFLIAVFWALNHPGWTAVIGGTLLVLSIIAWGARWHVIGLLLNVAGLVCLGVAVFVRLELKI